ncbi:MAG: MFS transporter [Planctomycetes bacterium]|nr:MFS transporter [Planctomycetota bacterium]
METSMNLTDNKYARVFTLCAMYFSQGMPFGFVTYLLASYMAGKGFDVKTVADLTAFSILPWAFKFVWGPLVDRFTIRSMGKRRPWIIFAQLCMMLTLAAMIFIPDLTENMKLLFALVFIANVFASMQDVAVDALAVDILEEKERAMVNGLMFGSASGGAAFCAYVLAKVMGHYDMKTAMAVQAAVLFGIMLLPILIRERDGEKLMPWTKGKAMGAEKQEISTSTSLFLQTVIKAFSIRSALIMLALCVVIKTAIELHIAYGSVYYIQNQGWKDVDFSAMRGIVELYTIAGCFIGGFLADKIGHKKIAIAATILFGSCYIYFGCNPQYWSNTFAVKIFFSAEGIIFGALSVSLFAMCMDISLPAVAGTQFTMYMAMMNLSSIIGKKLAGEFDKMMDYGEILIFWGVFQAVVISVLFLFINPKERKVLQTLQEQSKNL